MRLQVLLSSKRDWDLTWPRESRTIISEPHKLPLTAPCIIRVITNKDAHTLCEDAVTSGNIGLEHEIGILRLSILGTLSGNFS